MKLSHHKRKELVCSMNEVLDTKPGIENGTETEGVDSKRDEVEFKNVSFRYPDGQDYILHDVSFTAHKVDNAAILGAIGCGKTTAINLIPRFDDVSEGAVLVDGCDVREYDEKELINQT